MSNIKSVDELVKGMNPDQEIECTDYLDLSSACYVSRRKRVEIIGIDGDSDIAPRKDNATAFKHAVEQMKEAFSKPVIVAAADATHYHYVNRNISLYHIDFIRQNSKSWIDEVKEQKVGKPVQLNHSSDQKDTIGRVLVATPFIYSGVDLEDITKPNGHIELIYMIPDEDAIERMIDGRYRFMSVSATTTPDQVICSICNHSVASMDCEHMRGKIYDVKSEDSKKTTKKLAYWVWHKKRYKEVSYVTGAADAYAVQKKMSMINIPGMDSEDSALYNNHEQTSSFFSMMIGGMDKTSHILNLHEMDGEKVSSDLIISKDSIASDMANIDSSSESQNGGSSTDSTVTPPSTEESANTTQKESSDNDKIKYNNALAILLCDFIDLGLSLDDATKIAYNKGVYIPIKHRNSVEAFKDYIKNSLSKGAICRDALSNSVFAGPFRTVPIISKEYIDAAVDILEVFSKDNAAFNRINSTIDRKKQIMANVSNEHKQPTGGTNVAKYEFNTDDELLASPTVKKAIDELKTKHEQEIDMVNKARQDSESKLKTIAIDTIIDSALELDKPLTKAFKDIDSNDEKAVLAARDEIKKKLESRSFDSLIDTLDDYQSELALKAKEVADPNDQALENATNGEGAGSGTGDQTGSDANKGGDTPSSDGGSNGKAGEEINQPDSAAGSGSQEKGFKLSSIIKKQ